MFEGIHGRNNTTQKNGNLGVIFVEGGGKQKSTQILVDTSCLQVRISCLLANPDHALPSFLYISFAIKSVK